MRENKERDEIKEKIRILIEKMINKRRCEGKEKRNIGIRKGGGCEMNLREGGEKDWKGEEGMKKVSEDKGDFWMKNEK